MLDLIKGFMGGIYDFLPDSPFQSFFNSINFDFVHWLNWFIPFDLCFKITETWVAALALYYLFVIIKKVIFEYVLDIITSFLK